VKQTIAAITLLAFSLAAASANATGKMPLKFKIKTMAEGLDEAATEAGFHTESSSDCRLGLTLYSASNGGGVEVRSAYFTTAEEASRYFQWNLERAARVSEQGQNTNVNGKHFGRRAVLLLKTNAWQVMLTGGNTFRSFTASNRQILLEFEKQFTEPNLRKRGVSPK